MERKTSWLDRYIKVYNFLQLLVYIVGFLCLTWFRNSLKGNKNHAVVVDGIMVVMGFMPLIIMISISRLLFGNHKKEHMYDILTTALFGMIVLGMKMNVEDFKGYMMLLFCGFALLQDFNVWTALFAAVMLAPCFEQLWKHWDDPTNTYIGFLLPGYIAIMSIAHYAEHNEVVELIFLTASFLFKVSLVIFYFS